MPRISISEGLANGAEGIFDRLEDAVAAFDMATADITATTVTYTSGIYDVIWTGTGFAVENGVLTATEVTSLRLDVTGRTGYFIVYDQFDVTLANLNIAREAEATDPGATEALLSDLNWTIVSNSAPDNLWRGAQSADGAAVILNGNDRVFLDFGTNRLFAADGRDTVVGGQQADTIDGGAGNDRLFGRGGDDRLLGQIGHDLIEGDGGADFINGGLGEDTLLGGRGTDTILGGGGDDVIFGNAEDDRLRGNAGADIIEGGTGNDYLNGGSGNDSLVGDDGDDLLVGAAGNDTLISSRGADRLIGQAGADTFVLRPDAGTAISNRVMDFTLGEDSIMVEIDLLNQELETTQFAWGTEIRVGDDVFRVLGLQLDDLLGFDTVDGGVILF